MAGGHDHDQGGDDPLELVQLDEAFVRAAPVVELSADERIELLGLVPLRPQAPPEAVRDERGHSSWRRRRRRRLRALALLAVGALLGSAGWTLLTLSMSGAPRVGRWTDRVRVVRVPVGEVAAPGPHPQRRLPEVDPPEASGKYRFLDTQAETPVAFDPCRDVHWAVAPSAADPHLESLIGRVVGDVSAATGLKFVRDTTTDVTHSPVVFSVGSIPGAGTESVADTDTVADTEVKVAGEPGDAWIVGGSIILDGEGLARLSTDALQLRVLRHALGHIVGLDDVDDAREVMRPGGVGASSFAGGDRHGLARLGAVDCAGS